MMIASHSMQPTSLCALSHTRYFGFFGTLFLPIDIAEAYWSIYENVTNTTEVRIAPTALLSTVSQHTAGPLR